MKKNCNLLLILSIVFSIIIMIMCFIPIEFSNNLSSTTEKVLETVKGMDGAPGSGEYFMLIMPFALLADFGQIFYLAVFNILIPGTTLFSIVFLEAIARLFLIGRNKKWQNIVCFIFTILSVMVVSTLLFTLVLSVGLFKFISLFLVLVWIVIYIIQIVKMAGKLDECENSVPVVKNDIQQGTTQN